MRLCLAALGAILLLAPPATAVPVLVEAETQVVNVDAQGRQPRGVATNPSLSADGNRVAFSSAARTLVAGDGNDAVDIFVRDFVSGWTRRVSVSTSGREADSDSDNPAISADGRYISFSSYATNLVRGDRNEAQDVFVHDLVTGRTLRVSISSRGREADGDSPGSGISADGRYAVFTSEAANLVSRDTNGQIDVFVHDLATDRTTRVNLSSSGRQANRGSVDVSPVISANGRFVAFDSTASNLVAGDGNDDADVFLRDRREGTTIRVGEGLAGEPNAGSFNPSLSSDGRFVAFNSNASNLVLADTNEVGDVFVFDRSTTTTERVSVGTGGTQAIGLRNEDDPGSYGWSGWSSITGDGRYVAFFSSAINLVPEDSNLTPDVFVHDRQTTMTTRASVSSDGGQGSGWSSTPSISRDGVYVGFVSDSPEFDRGEKNVGNDVFRRGPVL